MQSHKTLSTVDKGIWNFCIKEAIKQKEWAKTHKYTDNPKEWPASVISIEMLESRLSKSVTSLAKEKYVYWEHRAKTMIHDMRLDPDFFDKWEKNKSGKKIKINT